MTARLDALDQRMAAVDQALASANQGLARLDEVADVAEDAKRASELFWPRFFPTGEPAATPLAAALGEPFDISVDSQFARMTSGRYTVLSAERLDNDVEVLIRWESRVGPLAVSSFSWRAYEDAGNQYDGAPYSGDGPDTGFPIEATLAQGRQREGSIYLLGAAGAQHLWVELSDFLGGGALAEVQLW